MVSLISNGLYIGSREDAETFDGDIVCVHEVLPKDEPEKAIWIPILKTVWSEEDENYLVEYAITQQLDMVAEQIDKSLKHGRKILIHCMAGIERSPLAVMWFFYKRVHFSLQEAFDYVKSKRPETQDRLVWLNLSYAERTA